MINGRCSRITFITNWASPRMAWLKEAVQSQAELMLKKTFDDFDMDTFVRRHIETQMRYWTTDSVRHQVANLLADRLVILSEDNEKINDSKHQLKN